MDKRMYDDICKRLLSNVRNLSILLKYCIREVKNYSVEEIEMMILDVEIGKDTVIDNAFIIGQNTEDIQDGNLIRFDIRFKIRLPVGEIIYIDVEIQNDELYDELMPRANFYASRMYAKQYGVEFDAKHYKCAKKTYSIWIMPRSSKERDGCINRYVQYERHIAGKTEEGKNSYNKMEIVTLFMYKNHNKNGKFEYYPEYDEILNPLSILLTNNIKDVKEKKRRLKEYGFKFMESEVDTMCNLSDGLIDEGRAEGREEKEIEVIKMLMKKGFTLLQVFDLLDVVEQERKYLQNLLLNES